MLFGYICVQLKKNLFMMLIFGTVCINFCHLFLPTQNIWSNCWISSAAAEVERKERYRR